MEMKRLCGFRIEIDKTPPVWSGTVSLRHTNFKEEFRYVTSTKASLMEAVKEIIEEYGEGNLRKINIHDHKE